MIRDIKKIASKIDIVELIERNIQLRDNGSHYTGICPFHDDHKSSLRVSYKKQYFKCFACGESGDAVDWLVKHGSTFLEAIDKIEGRVRLDDSDRPPVKLHVVRNTKPDWIQVVRPPFFPKKIRHHKHGKPSIIWGYYNSDGHPMGYICRFDLPGNEKEVIPFVYATDGKQSKWKWLGFKPQRPLYNLHKITEFPDRTIVLVEGEKTAQRTGELLPNHIATTWIGGADGVRLTDFTPLTGRSVVFFPDNDYPGYLAMENILKTVEAYIGDACFVNVWDKPHHWDLGDEPDWVKNDCLRFIHENLAITLDNPHDKPIPLKKAA